MRLSLTIVAEDGIGTKCDLSSRQLGNVGNWDLRNGGPYVPPSRLDSFLPRPGLLGRGEMKSLLEVCELLLLLWIGAQK